MKAEITIKGAVEGYIIETENGTHVVSGGTDRLLSYLAGALVSLIKEMDSDTKLKIETCQAKSKRKAIKNYEL
jgi:hypothetical protein